MSGAVVHDVLGEEELFVVGHDWGGPTAFAIAAQHRDAVKRLAIFDVPVPGDGTPVMFANRWHHGLHWELDFPEALTTGREDVYLGFFYRNWGGRPDAISAEAEREYLRAYRQPGAMRAGFNLYRATPQDVADNQAFLSEGKLKMPVLCYAGALGRGRGGLAIESWRRVAENVRGGVIEDCGHWILDPGRASAMGCRAVAGLLRRRENLSAFSPEGPHRLPQTAFGPSSSGREPHRCAVRTRLFGVPRTGRNFTSVAWAVGGVAVLERQDEFAISHHRESGEVVCVQFAGCVRGIRLDLRFAITELGSSLAKFHFVHAISPFR